MMRLHLKEKAKKAMDLVFSLSLFCSARAKNRYNHNTKKERYQRNLLLDSSCPIAMSPTPTEKYDVFISFRGEDTRDNFLSHLKAELCRKNINAFIDDRMDKGEEISSTLYTKIEQSMIYVIILSENYASSTWCLDELTKILECKQKYGRDVIPVFYKVDPSNVRKQKKSYAKAFIKHRRQYRDKVNTWKASITQAAKLSGWDSKEISPEHKLVTDIVEEILRKKMNWHCLVSDCEGMVGMDNHIEQIKSLLHLESEATRIVGIWGMSGIGKTAIAQAIYHRLAPQFNSSSMILDFEEETKRFGLSNIKRQYMSELLEEDRLSSRLRCSCVQRLKQTKVLLVLDDVNTSNLTIEPSNFGRGSRIILTSRDKKVLRNANADDIYIVKEMCFQDSLRLFSLNAFKQNYPINSTYEELSKKLVSNYAKGVPLALEELGTLLHGEPVDAWESQLQKLEKFPNKKIFDRFKSSYYDELDPLEKDIFLDIACFYTGHLVYDVAQQTLHSYGFFPVTAMNVFIDRGIISISEGRIVMHYLIQKIGQEIVRQQSDDDPRNQTRLWNPEEIYHVLINKGSNAIRCIFLDICKIYKVQLQADTFQKMNNLKILQFYKPFPQGDSNVILPESIKNLSHTLAFLRWDGFPQKHLPLEFCPKNLVKLDMRESDLEKLWEGDDQHLPNLKRLDLSHSKKLTKVPDLALSPNIEKIILSGCESLTEVSSSSFLSELNCLCLNGCVQLKSLHLPRNVLSQNPGLVVLYDCAKLELSSISSETHVFFHGGCKTHVVRVENLYFLF